MNQVARVVGPFITILVLIEIDRRLERWLDPGGKHGRRQRGILAYGYLVLGALPFVGMWGIGYDLNRGRLALVGVATLLTVAAAVAAVVAFRSRFGLDRR